MNKLEMQNRIKELELLVIDLTSQNTALQKQNKANTSMFLHEFLLQWIESHKSSIREATYCGYLQHLTSHLVPYFSAKKNQVKLQDIKAYHIEQYFSFKLNSGLSANTVRKHHATLRLALNYAVKHELIDKNPALMVELPAKVKRNYCTLNFAEIKSLIKYTTNTPMQAPIILGGIFGLRRSEILGLKWSNVDFNKHCMYINTTYIQYYDGHKTVSKIVELTKNNSSTRTLYIPEKFETIFKTIKFLSCNSEFVCVNKLGKLLTPNYVSKKFHDLSCNIAHNTQNIRLHDLRHSCATYLHDELGYDINDIQSYLGHSDVATTGNIYTHFSDKRSLEISKTINEIF